MTDAAVTLTVALLNFIQIEEGTIAPAANEFFEHGMRKDAGGREILADEIWSFLLFTPPAAGAPFPPFLMRNLKTPIYRK